MTDTKFTEEQVETLTIELHDGGAPCREVLRNAARLILQARAERDELAEHKAAVLERDIYIDTMEAERDAALVEIERLQNVCRKQIELMAAERDNYSAQLEAQCAETHFRALEVTEARRQVFKLEKQVENWRNWAGEDGSRNDK